MMETFLQLDRRGGKWFSWNKITKGLMSGQWEFPPRQKLASFNLDEVMRKLSEAAQD
jgi:hypothetical protein